MKEKNVKWNPFAEEYEPYEVPDGSVLRNPYCSPFDRRLVECASCGKEIELGKTVMSREIFDAEHEAFAVCKRCEKEEIKRRVAANRARREKQNGRQLEL